MYEVEAASEERQRWTPTTATGTKPTFTTPLFWPLPKVDHADCNSEACGANIRGGVVFQSKKAVDKFEGIPAMQYQDFLGPDCETGCEVVRPRGEQPPVLGNNRMAA